MTSNADRPALVIVGASVRGMAASATRAGFRVFAADLFGDHDLRTVASMVTTVKQYPDGIEEAVDPFPIAPVIYTGGLENHPRLLAHLAVRRPLAGSRAEAVARVRDPFLLARSVRGAGLHFPETRCDPAGLPVDGTWLIKPVASAGGRGIRPWFGQNTDGLPSVWQRRVPGRRFSVGYGVHAGQSLIIAVSRQLVGRGWCRAGPFAYCGSLDLDASTLVPNVASPLARLGALLANDFGLAGLVGADLLIDEQHRVWVIEINPRPTASMELVERATGGSLAAMHVASFGIESPIEPERHARIGTWAKAVLFARHDITYSEALHDALSTRASKSTTNDGWPAVADIPEPPCAIPAGAPVCTLFARGHSPRAALIRLRDRVAAIETLILGR